MKINNSRCQSGVRHLAPRETVPALCFHSIHRYQCKRATLGGGPYFRYLMDPDASTAASRLCSECGMCCNGVMFQLVQMQPGDSPAELSALGLKLKRKKGERYIQQPCPAFHGGCCSIYTSRPERCRRFECGQLSRLASGEISAEEALDRIRDLRRRVDEMSALLDAAGARNSKRPLSKRYESAVAEPIDASSDPSAIALRNTLTIAMDDLTALLNRDFRPRPRAPAPWRKSANALDEG